MFKKILSPIAYKHLANEKQVAVRGNNEKGVPVSILVPDKLFDSIFEKLKLYIKQNINTPVFQNEDTHESPLLIQGGFFLFDCIENSSKNLEAISVIDLEQKFNGMNVLSCEARIDYVNTKSGIEASLIIYDKQVKLIDRKRCVEDCSSIINSHQTLYDSQPGLTIRALDNKNTVINHSTKEFFKVDDKDKLFDSIEKVTSDKRYENCSSVYANLILKLRFSSEKNKDVLTKHEVNENIGIFYSSNGAPLIRKMLIGIPNNHEKHYVAETILLDQKGVKVEDLIYNLLDRPKIYSLESIALLGPSCLRGVSNILYRADQQKIKNVLSTYETTGLAKYINNLCTKS